MSGLINFKTVHLKLRAKYLKTKIYSVYISICWYFRSVLFIFRLNVFIKSIIKKKHGERCELKQTEDYKLTTCTTGWPQTTPAAFATPVKTSKIANAQRWQSNGEKFTDACLGDMELVNITTIPKNTFTEDTAVWTIASGTDGFDKYL